MASDGMTSANEPIFGVFLAQSGADGNRVSQKNKVQRSPMRLSVIVPVLNEADTLSKTLLSLRNQEESQEVIVVDGGSTDGSVEIARQYTSSVFLSAKSRGLQQHTGARQAKGDVLVFLHADTCLPAQYACHIRRSLAKRQVVFGAFLLAIHPPSPLLNTLALAANLRSFLFKLPYGDQALFMPRSIYFQTGGFRPWPIMEDVDFVRRLNRVGAFQLVRSPVKTSARRWEKEHPLFTTVRNWSLITRYYLGVRPEALVRHYPHAR
jgi:rSAM/selenodomain-associated transferase 2